MKCRRGLAMRFLSLRLSVRPSVKRVECAKTKEKSVQIFVPCERPFTLFLWEKTRLVGGDPFYVKFWVNHSASAVRPSEKSSINTNKKSPTRFPTSLRWSSYVAPKSPKGAEKRKTAVFPLKSHFAWRKSATKFLYVKTVNGKVVGHSLV